MKSRSYCILCLTGNYKTERPIGTAVYSRYLVNALKRTKISQNVTVISFEYPMTVLPSNPFSKVLSTIYRYFLELVFLIKVLGKVTSMRPSLIICLEEAISPLCLLLRYIFKIKYAVVVHDPNTWDEDFFLINRSLEKAAWIIANSNNTYRSIYKKMPPGTREFFVLTPPVDGNKFSPEGKDKSLMNELNLDGHKVILSVGRLDSWGLKRKRQDIVIKALSLVKNKIADFKCLFVGSGDQLHNLKRMSKDLGLDDNIIFLGDIDRRHLPSYYNLCDLFVLPSKHEAFGMSYLEALACGKPVIGSTGTGAEDALLHGQLGLLINPDDINSLSDAMIRVLRKETEQNLTDPRYLREKVLSYYGMDMFRQNLENCLEMMTSKNISMNE